MGGDEAADGRQPPAAARSAPCSGPPLGVTLGCPGGGQAVLLVRPYARPRWSFVILSTPVFLLAVLLKVRRRPSTGTPTCHRRLDLYFVGEIHPGPRRRLLRAVQRPARPPHPADARHRARPDRLLQPLPAQLDARRAGQRLPPHRPGQGPPPADGAASSTGCARPSSRWPRFFAYSFGLLLTGATFTEKIFGWHGMGEWFIDSINNNDVNVVAAVDRVLRGPHPHRRPDRRRRSTPPSTPACRIRGEERHVRPDLQASRRARSPRRRRAAAPTRSSRRGRLVLRRFLRRKAGGRRRSSSSSLLFVLAFARAPPLPSGTTSTRTSTAVPAAARPANHWFGTTQTRPGRLRPDHAGAAEVAA